MSFVLRCRLLVTLSSTKTSTNLEMKNMQSGKGW